VNLRRAVESVVGKGAHGAASGVLLSVPDIARNALDAAAAGLQRAIEDPGLRFTFYLLTQIVLAVRKPDWEERLSDLGIALTPESSLFDFTAALQNTVDGFLESNGPTSDISEMAQQAAGQAITELVGPKSKTLFGSGPSELQDGLYDLSTKAGFARLGQHFFGCFMSRFLNFYLSRITAGQVGGPRIERLSDLTRFNDALEVHCKQSAQVVHDFCGEWYSKTEFERGISLENTTGFMAVALKKLQSELMKQGEGHD